MRNVTKDLSRHSVTSTGAGALAALSLSMLLSSLGTSIANVTLPSLAEAFAASFQQVQWVVIAYLLAATSIIVSVGRLGDIIGRKRLLMIGILTFIVGAIMAGVAPTLWLLIAARAIQGAGAATMMALSMALVGETAEAGRTGRAMGLLGAASAIGTALGPSLGGLLIAAAGWRSIFLVAVPIGALTLALAHYRLPHRAAASGKAERSFDGLGTLLLVATLGAFALSMTIGRGRFGVANLILLGAAIAGLPLFLSSQRSAKTPLIELTTLRDPRISTGLAMSLLVSTVLMATLVVGPFYLARTLGLNAAAVGIVLSAGPLAVACSGAPAGRAVDRFGTPMTIFAGLTVIFGGSLLLSVLPAKLGLLGYIPPMVALTVGYGLFQTANNVAVVSATRPDQRGVVAGLLNLSRNLGLIAGASGMGAVFAGAARTTDIASASPDAVAGATRVVFAIAAFLIVVALALTANRNLSQARRMDPR